MKKKHYISDIDVLALVMLVNSSNISTTPQERVAFYLNTFLPQNRLT